VAVSPTFLSAASQSLRAMRPPRGPAARGGLMTPGVRPEDNALAAGQYYDGATTAAYTRVNVLTQRELTAHAMELLVLPIDGSSGGGGGGGRAVIADVGCGSGLSGEELTRRGHAWVGLDASASMLSEAVGGGGGGGSGGDGQKSGGGDGQNINGGGGGGRQAHERHGAGGARGAVALADFSHGLPFRPDAFDACVSISAVQWLCVGTPSEACEKLERFFRALARCLRPGSRAVLQVYPATVGDTWLMEDCARRAGLAGAAAGAYTRSRQSST